MELFAYISLKDLDRILRGKYDEVGVRFEDDTNRATSYPYQTGVNYIELFEGLDGIEVLQEYNAYKPDFIEGGVVMRVQIPKKLIGAKDSKSVFRIEERGQERFLELKTYPVQSKHLRTDNFVDAVFDRDCCSTVEEIKDEMDFKCSPRSMGE